MAYLVLARKWRPQDFTSITGQEHVTKTLVHAIEQDRVHHAFLFCGARGVGKTTAARVLARALNCRSFDGPTPQPCGTCQACVEIAQGTSVDVFEIDGASNRGIGEIRELRDGIAYAPQNDRFKIYIIDEVHMLTTEAFNALLKTLEEPPAHVKFVFATTEPERIPVTILSRCQRFDFKRIPLDVMVARFEEILAQEGVSIDARGLRLVARESEGSMRDGLSLLDRIISFAGTEASYEDVASILGAADRRWLGELARASLAGDTASALHVIQDVFEHGSDLRQFAGDFVHYLRDVTVLRVAGPGRGLTELSDEEERELVALGRDRAPEDLDRLFRLAVTAAERLAHANHPRLELEMAAVRMASLRPLVPLDHLVKRLAALERHLDQGQPIPPELWAAPVTVVAAPAMAASVAPAPRPDAEPEPAAATGPGGALPAGQRPSSHVTPPEGASDGVTSPSGFQPPAEASPDRGDAEPDLEAEPATGAGVGDAVADGLRPSSAVTPPEGASDEPLPEAPLDVAPAEGPSDGVTSPSGLQPPGETTPDRGDADSQPEVELAMATGPGVALADGQRPSGNMTPPEGPSDGVTSPSGSQPPGEATLDRGEAESDLEPEPTAAGPGVALLDGQRPPGNVTPPEGPPDATPPEGPPDATSPEGPSGGAPAEGLSDRVTSPSGLEPPGEATAAQWGLEPAPAPAAAAAPARAAASAAGTPAPAPAGPAPDRFSGDDWERFLDAIRAEHVSLAGSLDHGEVRGYEAATLRVGFARGSFNAQVAERHHGHVVALLRQHVGDLAGLEIEGLADGVGDSPFLRRKAREEAAVRAREESLRQHPTVRAVQARFDGTLVRVEVTAQDASSGRATGGR